MTIMITPEADTILVDRERRGSQNDCADPLDGDPRSRPLDFLAEFSARP